MKKPILIIILFCIPYFKVIAQKESNIWYFGEYAGLDFNSGSPLPLSGGKLNTSEGCATISDNNGNLLFYTDGISVWNQNNLIMTNGTGLEGNVSSTQSGVIIPQPGSSTLYYIFTTDAQVGAFTGNNGNFCYNVVDMSLSGGLGSVTTKNQVLMPGMVEKIAAARASNGTDIWVIAHQWNSNAFYAYLVTDTGISAPVISNSGIVHQDVGSGINAESIGYMKLSPDAKKLALACDEQLNTIQIFDFNDSTGVISNPITDNAFPNKTGYDGPYGISFSPDNSRLYVGMCGYIAGGGIGYVYQYNMNAGSPAAIIASKTTVLKDSLNEIAALQIGPDGKIYVAKENGVTGLSSYLDVINCPNSLGVLCDYVSNGLYLATSGHSLFGLPDFVDLSALFTLVPYSASLDYSTCTGTSTLTFNDTILNGAVNFLWDFGDPASGFNNTSDMQFPTHIFSSFGTYAVTLYIGCACKTDTFVQTIVTGGSLSVDAIPDTTICSGNYVQLNSSGGTQYQWSPASGLSDSATADPFATPLTTTTYTVTVSSGSCNSTATVSITVISSPPTPNITVSNDTLHCSYDTSYISYQWYDDTTLLTGESNSYYFVTQNGNYNVSVANSFGCSIAVGINFIINDVKNYLSGNYISISPNPATNQLTIHTSSLHNGAITVSIMNVLGQEASPPTPLQGRGEDALIDVSKLSSGIYFLQMRSESGSEVRKFVKE